MINSTHDEETDDESVRLWNLPNMGGQAVNAFAIDERKRRKEAEIKPPSAEELQGLRDAAREEGFQEGYQEGARKAEKEGREKLEKELRVKKAQLEQLIAAMARPLEAMEVQAERALIDVILTLTRHVIRRELIFTPEQIVAIVRETVAQMPLSQQQLRLYLQTDDARLVREAMALDPPMERQWVILEDPNQVRGGARVVGVDSRIDASLETRIQLAFEHVLNARDRSDDDDDLEHGSVESNGDSKRGNDHGA